MLFFVVVDAIRYAMREAIFSTRAPALRAAFFYASIYAVTPTIDRFSSPHTLTDTRRRHDIRLRLYAIFHFAAGFIAATLSFLLLLC